MLGRRRRLDHEDDDDNDKTGFSSTACQTHAHVQDGFKRRIVPTISLAELNDDNNTLTHVFQLLKPASISFAALLSPNLTHWRSHLSHTFINSIQNISNSLDWAGSSIDSIDAFFRFVQTVEDDQTVQTVFLEGIGDHGGFELYHVVAVHMVLAIVEVDQALAEYARSL